MIRTPFLLTTLTLAVAAPLPLRAQPTPSNPAPPAPSSPAPAPPSSLSPASVFPTPSAPPLGVKLALGPRNLDPERVRLALERELQKPVVRVEKNAALELDIDAQGRLNARYLQSGGNALVRQLDLPADDDRALEVMALLAGNLARDEASELARELEAEAARRAAEKQAVPAAPAPPLPPEPRVWLDSPSVNLSLFHPLAVSSDSEQHRFRLELGLAYSRIGALAGFGATFGALHVDGPMEGVGLGMLWARAGEGSSGLLASFAFVQARGAFEGASLSSGVAWHSGSVDGAELAVALAVAGDVVGVQGAGGVAIAKSVQGLQGAAGVSIATGPVEGMVGAGGVVIARDVDGLIGAAGVSIARDVQGAMLTGGVNIVRDSAGALMSAGVNVARDVEGLVATGGVNVTRDVNGVALAPINVSRRVDGVQIGVVNVASEVHGAAIGLVNIAGNGRVQPQVWSSTEVPLHASVKFVAGYAYSELGMAFDRESSRPDDPWTLGFEAGIGPHIPLGDRFALEPGFHYSEFFPSKSFDTELEVNFHYRLRAAFDVLPWLGVFGGSGARHGISGRTKDDVAPEFFAGLSLF